MLDTEPYYDPRTDRIENCSPGSYAWEHENRHREQYQRGWGTKADNLHNLCYYAAFFAAPLALLVGGMNGFVLAVGYCFLPHLFALMFLESDAYIRGYYRWRKWRKQ